MMQEIFEMNDMPRKQPYAIPTITSYNVQDLQAQLGPARAVSEERSPDEDLFGEEY